MPDHIVARMNDVEARMGLEPIEVLHARRDILVAESATLHAMYGAWGVFEHRRKSLLATLAMAERGKATEAGVKVTEAALDQAAHAHEEYTDFITQALDARAELFVKDNAIASITELINRGNVVGRYLASEPK